MTRAEWSLLTLLAGREGRIVPTAELAAAIPSHQRGRRVIRPDLHQTISRLRGQIRPAGVEIRREGPRNRPGLGYGLFDTLALRGKAHV